MTDDGSNGGKAPFTKKMTCAEVSQNACRDLWRLSSIVGVQGREITAGVIAQTEMAADFRSRIEQFNEWEIGHFRDLEEHITEIREELTELKRGQTVIAGAISALLEHLSKDGR